MHNIFREAQKYIEELLHFSQLAPSEQEHPEGSSLQGPLPEKENTEYKFE